MKLPDNARSFVAADPPRHATIATVDADGGPHQVVIWYRFESGDHADEADDGDRFVVNSRIGRRWPTNLQRDERASLAIHDGEDAVTVECRVERSYRGDAALADISEMGRRYYGAESAEPTIAVFATQERVTFVLRPTKVHIHGDPD